jgi:hypothetical protein
MPKSAVSTVFTLLVVVLAPLGLPAQETGGYAGRPLGDVLRELEEPGLLRGMGQVSSADDP